MAECNLEQIIKSGVERALNEPIVNGMSITQWAEFGMMAPQWVPVEDGLPELYQTVLVYAVGKIDGFIGDHVYALCSRYVQKIFPSSPGHEEWSIPWSYFHVDYKITHWMPLPEPPKEDEYLAESGARIGGKQMTLHGFQAFAARTINKELTKSEMEAHALFGLASEVGEVLGLYQKVYQGHTFDVDKVIDEGGDVLWMLAELFTVLGISLDDVAQHNVDKLKARYPEGFSAERSLHREEK